MEYNRAGTRLLCEEGDYAVIHEIPIEEQLVSTDDSANGGNTLRFTTKSNSIPGLTSCGFAGDNDQFVVASLYKGDMQIWTVPEGKLEEKELINDQPLFALPMPHKCTKYSFSYSRQNCALAASGWDGICIWTPFNLNHSTGTEQPEGDDDSNTSSSEEEMSSSASSDSVIYSEDSSSDSDDGEPFEDEEDEEE